VAAHKDAMAEWEA